MINDYFSENENPDSSITSGLSLSSISSVQKFSTKEGARCKGQCYMGICLPLVLTDLFPPSESNRTLKSTYKTHSFEGKFRICNPSL